ncbi:MAG TPA: hypothetical protein VN894_10090 [Polyangiaceae bacterium]|nr:hypothetical protein [Polyangiaceae bacterium]
MTARKFLNALGDVLDAVDLWATSRKGRLSPEEKDLIGAYERYQTMRQRPRSMPPPRVKSFPPDEQPTKQRKSHL